MLLNKSLIKQEDIPKSEKQSLKAHKQIVKLLNTFESLIINSS